MYQLLVIVLAALILISLYIYFKRRKYTRERFIFFSTLMLFGFAGTVLTHIFVDKSLIRLIAEFYNLMPIADIQIQATSWSDKLWSILILLALMIFIYHIFLSWNGEKSKYDFQLEAQNRDLSIFQAFIKGSSFKKIEQQSEEHTSFTENKKQPLGYLDDDLDWHTEVKELLKMSSRQYKITESDWHNNNGAYLSKYHKKNIIIICSLQDIDGKSIKGKITDIKSLTNSQIYKVFVCVKFYSSETARVLHISGIEEDLAYTYKHELLEGLVDFEEYYDYINSQYDHKEISTGDGVYIKDIYVPSRGKTMDFTKIDKTHDKSNEIKDVGEYLLSWIKNNFYEKQISLLGEYGQGKSVLSLWLAMQMINGDYDRIPIIIELRGKSPRNETLPNIISSWAIRFHIDPMAMQKLLQEGRLLIILEGFDELDMIGDSNRRLEHFKKLWEFARYKKSKGNYSPHIS